MNTALSSAAALLPVTVALYPLNIYWPGKGGIFRGIKSGKSGEPDRLVFEHTKELPIGNYKAALAAAVEVEAEGHKDFHVPDRAESALLYAVAKDEHDQNDWYWMSEPDGSAWAWVQFFDYGSQHTSHQRDDCRAVAVRSEPIQ